MIPGRIVLKRRLKQCAGYASVLSRPFVSRSGRAAICILNYHRVADIGFVDPETDDWNVPPRTFERHIAALTEIAEIVRVEEIPGLLEHRAQSVKPMVCITFDDGYGNFFTQALPILQRYAVPATLFLVTDVVGKDVPMPFDGWSRKHGGTTPREMWRPLTWEEVHSCLASGLISVGAHSHTHRNGLTCSPSDLREEAELSMVTLRNKCGNAFKPIFSYPYGSVRLGQVPPQYVDAVQRAGFEMGLTTDLGLVTPESNLYSLPRMEAHPLDGPAILHAKVSGAIAPYKFTDWLRVAQRST